MIGWAVHRYAVQTLFVYRLGFLINPLIAEDGLTTDQKKAANWREV